MLPYGLMNRIDWRSQVTLMFQVDSYRLNLAPDQMPAFPAAPAAAAATQPRLRSPSRRWRRAPGMCGSATTTAVPSSSSPITW